MGIRTVKIENVVHVYDDAMHLGQIVERRGQLQVRKDHWPCTMPVVSFSKAIEMFKPPRMLGLRTSGF